MKLPDKEGSCSTSRAVGLVDCNVIGTPGVRDTVQDLNDARENCKHRTDKACYRTGDGVAWQLGDGNSARHVVHPVCGQAKATLLHTTLTCRSTEEQRLQQEAAHN